MPKGIYVKTKEYKENMSKIMKGKLPWNTGKHRSEETKRKMSKAFKGKVTWMKGKHHSEETKRKLSEARKGRFAGELCPSWKGGITPLTKRIRTSFEYRQWRSDIFTRDDFTCQKCDRRGIYLHAHHKEAFSDIMELNDIKTYEQAMNCEELWNINNGITLCKKCHKGEQSKGE